MDKISKQFLKYMETLPDHSYESLNPPKELPAIRDRSEFIILAEHLENTGYVTIFTFNGFPAGVSLTHKGIHWKEFRHEEILSYLLDKWVDCVALLLSIISLCLSILK